MMERVIEIGLTELLRVVVAYLLAIPVAWEREKSTRIMGLRTFPLVAVASCGYVLVAQTMAGGNEEALARVIQGLMTGIGFIGGGALLKHGATVRGTATAASVWMTGALGASAGFGQYGLAVILATVNFATLRFLKGARETEELDREAARSDREAE